MTIKRKPDAPDEFEIPIGKGTLSFRTVLLLLVLSATPFGQQLLKQFGVQTPAYEGSSQLAKAVTDIHDDVSDLRAEVADLKKDVGSIRTQSDKLQLAFTGFQVDFEKYKQLPR